MMKSDHEYLAEALANIRPNSVEWNILGNEIQWLDDTPPPTTEEINAEIENIKGRETGEEYKIKRKSEYPNLADFADAYYWEKMGNSTLMDAYLEQVSSVKNKFPK